MSFIRRLTSILEQLIELGRISNRTVIGVTALILATTMLESIGVALILPLMDFIQNNAPASELASRSKFWSVLVGVFTFLHLPVTLATLSGVIFALVLSRQIVQYLAAVKLGAIRLSVEQNLRGRLFEALQNARSQNVQRVAAGSFIELISLQCTRAAVLVESLGRLFANSVILVAYAILTLFVATGPSLIAIVSVGIGLLALNVFVRMIRQQSQILVQVQKKFTGWAGERISGWRLIKLANSAEREVDHFRSHTDELARVELKIVSIGALTQGIMVTAMTMLILIALYMSVSYLDLNVAVVTLFAVILMRLMPVAMSFTRTRQNIENRLASLNRITEIQDDLGERREQIFQGQPELEIQSAIRFENISFAYDSDERGALKDVTAEIPIGQMTAIVGPSGSGKSTLSDMILRLLEPASGQMYFDDVESGKFQIAAVRRAIAYLPQQPIIFNESVFENVRYMKPSASEEQVIEACRKAYAHDFVMDLPDGYQTALGESGNTLSGGQRQRIALARALLSDAKVLVLDEPTSALDTASEQMIRKTINHAVRDEGLTIVIIAHGLALTQDADYAILLEQGKVIDQGPAARLIDRISESAPRDVADSAIQSP